VRIADAEFKDRLDSKAAEIAGLDAQLQSIAKKTDTQALRISQAKSDLSVMDAEDTQMERNLQRSDSLSKKGYVSRQQYETAETQVAVAKGKRESAELQLRIAQSELGSLDADRSRLMAEREKAEADRAILAEEFGDTVIRAPISGVVGNRAVQKGEFVAPGKFLLAVVDLDGAWVEANFKETQLHRMKVGQRVTVSLDAYPGQVLIGTIASLSPATGAQFSLIPAENASGNFNKVVQRVPVRIAIARDPARPLTLRPGMSSVVSVMTNAPAVSPAATAMSGNQHAVQ
jgi:membrane fusion protein (multidrug efflux system)